MKSTLLLALAITGFTLCTPGTVNGVDLSWYPPNATSINNLTSALTASGTYGFIFDSSYPSGVSYGTYNWCNMPHVRKQEYVIPNKKYKLKYVELIHRHHKRTVYASNSFPVESYGWNCDDEGLYYYGQPQGGHKSAHTYWQGYLSQINPFKPTGFIGTCQFPQITKEGLDDSWQHGRDLYQVYHDLLGFLPSGQSKQVEFRVTQNQITSQVAGMVLNGMFSSESDTSLLVAPSGFDSLEPTYSCTTSSNIYTAERSSAAWTNHLTAAASLYATLDDISGVPPAETSLGFHVSLDHYYDNLSARQCHNKPLPCKLVNGQNSTTCITQPLANEVYRLGQWEYSYLYRDSPTSLNAATASMGVWMGELAKNIRDNLSGKSNIRYRQNVAHDGSVSRVLSFLQVRQMVWPGMGAEVLFEIHELDDIASDTSNHFVRVLFGGKVLESSNPTLGVMNLIPLDNLLAYIDGLVGVNASLIAGKCNGTIPF